MASSSSEQHSECSIDSSESSESLNESSDSSRLCLLLVRLFLMDTPSFLPDADFGGCVGGGAGGGGGCVGGGGGLCTLDCFGHDEDLGGVHPLKVASASSSSDDPPIWTGSADSN